MVVDRYSPIAPARIRALALPMGRIKRSRFTSFVERLVANSVVRLGDITPDGRVDRRKYSLGLLKVLIDCATLTLTPNCSYVLPAGLPERDAHL
jgi:hypothetical protein